jgi:hypothetical protein
VCIHIYSHYPSHFVVHTTLHIRVPADVDQHLAGQLFKVRLGGSAEVGLGEPVDSGQSVLLVT